jgi:hypothetical protein
VILMLDVLDDGRRGVSGTNRLVLASVLVGLPVTGCGGGGDHLSCAQRQSLDYPALESVARKTLDGKSFDLYRHGACEDTGAPRAAVEAEVSGWSTRRAGVRYLMRHGWNLSTDGLIVSRDQKFEAECVGSGHGVTSSVSVTFRRLKENG